MKTQWTQGDWRYNEHDNIIELASGANRGRLIDITPRSLCVPIEERNANGYLIAAAPDLFFALQALVSDHEQGLDFEISWSIAKAALAKAL